MAEEEQNTAQTPQIQLPEHAESLQQDNAQDLHPVRVEQTAGQEQPDLHPVRVEQTAEQEQPDLHPVRVEQTAETVNTVLPAVRGNEMPERAQEPMVLKGQETNLVQSFGNYAQKPSKESLEAFAFDLQHVVADYVGSGMTPAAATQKASELLGEIYDRAESQNLDPQMLANLRNAKEAANKFMAQEVEKLNATPTMLNEVNAGRRNENIEDAVYEEMPTEPVVESENNDTAGSAPVTPEKESENNDTAGSAPVTPGKESESNDTTGSAPVTPKKESESHDTEDTSATSNNGKKDKEEEADRPDVPGSFHFGKTAETENINTESNTDDLLEQMMNTAFKNRYMMLEDVENDPSHLCPFRQFKTSTLKDNSGDKKNPYVSMELQTGARVYNRPGQIDVHYDTKEGEDYHISFEDALALVRLGQEKGWTSANLEGPKEYKEQMFLAMYTLGMKVHGDFIPSKDLLKKAEEQRNKYLADVQHAASIDQRFSAIEAERKAVGIERPEDVGKEFMNRLKDAGLGYQPVQQKDNEEKTSSPNEQANVKEYSEKLKEVSGIDWEFKDAEHSALKINNLRAPDSEELRKKLDAAGIRYGEAVKGDQKLLTVNTDEPLYLTEEEKKARQGQEAEQQQSQSSAEQQQESQQQQQSQLPAGPQQESQQPQQPQLPAGPQQESQQQQQPQLPAGPQQESQQPQTAALVPLTPEIQNKKEAMAQASITALAKTNPVKAQQAAAQIAATPGTANQLQLIGKTANEAKGNDARMAQQQHHQQETAIVLASRNNGYTK